ncbi:MAG TPA: T9SS type A sorting domain-containing protein, partial [Ignavibacteria bacterium]|nr:T9SS type A sorting domain-containing protein [Ignavibacteria bacterium]HMR41869.1 T9SS type A sorting domain-containing protein [Ignavibacteria bacterium]
SNIYATKTDSLCNAPLIVSIADNNSIFPKEIQLYQNYPNPFNPVTTINFSIPKQGNVKLEVYDVTGKKVKTLINGLRAAGNYTINFSATEGGSNLSSGVYFYRIESGDFIEVKRMILIK